MKNWLFILFITLTSSVYANSFETSPREDVSSELLCAYEQATYYKQIVKVRNFARDKYKHCTISCIVGLECGLTSTAILGMAKEIYDVFGPGHAELEDLLANFLGLRISRRGSVSDLDSCSSACQQYYPIKRKSRR